MKQKRNPLTWRWDLTWKDVHDTGPLQILIVDELPAIGEPGTIYIVKWALYSTMYVWDPDHNVFVKVGTTQLTLQEQADWLQTDTTAVDYIKNKPILAEVATTGSFYSLVDAPEIPEVYNTTIRFKKNWLLVWTITLNQENEADIDFNIPTKTSELENDAWFIDRNVNNLRYYTKTVDLAPVALSNDYEDLDNKPTIPTKLSEFENDMWFIDNTVNNLVNYYTKNKLYTKQQIDEMLGNLSGIRIEIVSELPNPWEFGVIYLIETETPGTYIQYILTEAPNTYAEIGSTAVDLSQYFNKTTDTSDDITQWDTNLFMTEAEKINLSHQSWYNTGDETKITIMAKMWPASATNDWYLKKEDWTTFNNKVDYEDFVWVDASSGSIAINDFSTQTTANNDITINVWPRVRSGLVYLLKISATNDISLNLGNWVTNTNWTILSVPAGKTKVFVMLAISDTELAMQGNDTTWFITQEDMEDYVWNGRVRIRYDWEVIGQFRLNQWESLDIDIPKTISKGIFSQIWTVIGQSTPDVRVWRANHWFAKAPWVVDVDLYSQIGPDQYNRQTCSRAMATWQNWVTDFLGTILYFSNAGNEQGNPTMSGNPWNMDELPISIMVTNTEIIITANDLAKLTKFRVTAYE